MRDPARIERILDKIKEIWVRQPDTRFNQLVHNLKAAYSSSNNNAGEVMSYSKNEYPNGAAVFNLDVSHVDLFNLEDDKFELFLDEYIAKMKSS